MLLAMLSMNEALCDVSYIVLATALLALVVLMLWFKLVPLLRPKPVPKFFIRSEGKESDLIRVNADTILSLTEESVAGLSEIEQKFWRACYENQDFFHAAISLPKGVVRSQQEICQVIFEINELATKALHSVREGLVEQ